MLGSQHLLLSLGSAAVLLSPYATERPFLSVVALSGVALGSLIPDVDAKDAKVFHRSVTEVGGTSGRLINGSLGLLFPIFGYITKYAIYRPSLLIYDLAFRNYSFEDSHRSFSHSLLGVLTMTALTGAYLYPLLRYFGASYKVHFSTFLLSYMAGAFLHMLQDSSTKTGIAWNYPFSSRKLSGELVTGEDVLKPRLFVIFLFSSAALLLFTSETRASLPYQLGLPLVSAASLAVSWIGFMIAAGAGVEA
ncbi:MAG: metal-dependent hydrolase [Candidatus Nanohaloarchaea archaeon]